MIVIGIDPGLTGCMAGYDPDRDFVTAVVDFPVRERVYGTGKEVDWTLFKNYLFEMIPEDMNVLIALENVGVMPAQGIVSAYSFGQTVGGIRAVIETMGLDYVLIHPASWKKHFGLTGSQKHDIITMLKNVYAETVPMLTLKKHHNRADAIAIAIAGGKHVRS